MRYRVDIPGWYEGVLTCEEVGGKDIVVEAPEHMKWAVGKNTLEVFAYYRYMGRNNGGTVIEPVGSKQRKRKIKVVSRKKRVVRIKRRK